MLTIVSGQAGIIAIPKDEGYEVQRVDSGVSIMCSKNNIHYYFVGCKDIEYLAPLTKSTPLTEGTKRWRVAQAISLFRILMDSDEPADILNNAAEALDELLAEPGTFDATLRRAFFPPLDQPAHIRKVARISSERQKILELLEKIVAFQPEITHVESSLARVPTEYFSLSHPFAYFKERAATEGVFHDFAIALRSNNRLSGALFTAYDRLNDVDNYRAIIDAWTHDFSRPDRALDAEFGPEDSSEYYGEDELPPAVQNRRANALARQDAIFEELKNGHFRTARRFANDLIKSQSQQSSVYLAKSLIRISQMAKTYKAYALAMEWLKQAIDVKYDDGLAHSQLADLFITLGRYDEASQSLEMALAFGGERFALTGLARSLRHQHRYDEALAAYKNARETDPRNVRNWAGVAESLRDLGRFSEAREVYNEAISKFPDDPALQAGLGATLVELGLFDEALDSYAISASLEANPLVAMNGIATIKRKTGRFSEAEADYKKIVNEYPYDIYSRIGLSTLYRILGDHDQAIAVAKHVAMRFPESEDGSWALADTLINAQRLDEAREVIDNALQAHQNCEGLTLGLAKIERAKGNLHEALRLFTLASRRFPWSIRARIGRADTLRKLGNIAGAFELYAELSQSHPNEQILLNRLASTLMIQGHYERAAEHLNVASAKSEEEWYNVFLQGMCSSQLGQIPRALEIFGDGLSNCPFPFIRRIMGAALSRQQMMLGEKEAAVESSSLCVGDFTEILRFHALAACDAKGPARILYERLKGHFEGTEFGPLNDEIALNFDITDGKSSKDQDWIFHREAELLILEAA